MTGLHFPAYRVHLRLGNEAREVFLDWWERMKAGNYSFSCYAVFLMLPSDQEIDDYLYENWDELHLLSADECLIAMFYEETFNIFGQNMNDHFNPNRERVFDSDTNEVTWKSTVGSYAKEGYSVALAQIFGIKLSEFPSILLFKDMQATEFIQISLKGMSVEEITVTMREIFTIIHEAAKKSLNPIIALKRRKRRNSLKHNGKTILSTVGSAAKTTFEAAIEAWVSAMLKP